jgi:N6-adenosine-specific RNA methylase IME4
MTISRKIERPVGFSTILADPPWPESDGGKCKRGADKHYELMKVGDIISLPVGTITASNAHLWLWTTNNYLEPALRAMSAWGFRYVTNVVWGKFKDDKVQVGLGQYFRGSHELLLFGVRGKLPSQAPRGTGARLISTLQLHPRSTHNAKPEEFYTLIETVSPGARVELFARKPRHGWTSVGDDPALFTEDCVRLPVDDGINELAHNRERMRLVTGSMETGR